MLSIWECIWRYPQKVGLKNSANFLSGSFLFDLGWTITKCKLTKIAFRFCLSGSAFGGGNCPHKVELKNSSKGFL